MAAAAGARAPLGVDLHVDDDTSYDIPYLLCFALSLTASVVCVWLYFQTRSRFRRALAGDETASPILPIYLSLMRALPFLVLVASFAFALELLVCVNLPEDNLAICDITLYAVWETMLEALALSFVLLMTGRAVTPRAMRWAGRRGLAFGVVWGVCIFFSQLISNTCYTVVALLLHLTALGVFSYLKTVAQRRRPAAVRSCQFEQFFRSVFALCHLLHLLGAESVGKAVDQPAILLYAAGLIVLYVLTLRWDSQYWRGIGSRLVARHQKGRGAGKIDDLEQHTLQMAMDVNQDLLLDWAFLRISPQTLGRGAFAAVFSGQFRGQPVAVKVFQPPEVTDREVLRFMAETRLSASLSHPNVVQVLGLVVCPPTICLVVELCDLGDLRTVLDNVDFSLRERFELCRQATLGVAYVHSLSPMLLHRDIKSFNYLVSSGEGQALTVKLSDFGEARAAAPGDDCSSEASDATVHISPTMPASPSAPAMTIRVGTALWMAPEMIDHHTTHYGDKVDVYSLGIVLWEILTGSVPYDDIRSYVGVFRDVLAGRRPEIPDYCPQPMAELMTAMWEPEPEDRPSASEALARIEAFVEAEYGGPPDPAQMAQRGRGRAESSVSYGNWGETLADFDWHSAHGTRVEGPGRAAVNGGGGGDGGARQRSATEFVGAPPSTAAAARQHSRSETDVFASASSGRGSEAEVQLLETSPGRRGRFGDVL